MDVPQPDDEPLISGIPNAALLAAMPILANFADVTWYTGYFRALSIPLWYITISPVEIFIIGLFSVIPGFVVVMAYLALKRAGRTARFDQDTATRVGWIFACTVGGLFIVYAWGYSTPLTRQWDVVAGFPGCVIITRTGTNVIASEYDIPSRRLRGRLTLYPIDKLPAIDVYRVQLDIRAGIRQAPITEPPACPASGSSQKK